MAATHVLTRCSSCGTENRVPVERIGQTGRCGRCKTPLTGGDVYSPVPVEIGDGKFDVLTRLSARPVLADFWAEWCAPCRHMEPVLDRLASEEAGRLLVIKVDTERAGMTTARFGIQAIPTMILLRSGIEVERITGVVSIEALRARVAPFL